MQESKESEIRRDIHISIVSHHHAQLVQQLLLDLSRLSCAPRIQLTLTSNIPEVMELDGLGYPVHYISNKTPAGFGENHNQAFNHLPLSEERDYFLVLNPDVRIYEDIITTLITRLAADKNIGVIAPRVVNSDGDIEDNARELPTFSRLLKKSLGQRAKWDIQGKNGLQPDWVAGMFMLFPAESYRQAGGFNEKFYLYYEDVDLCSRLWLKGLTVQLEPSVSIVHDAQRASHRQLKFLLWHLSSIAYFLTSRVYRRVKILHKRRG